MNFDLKISNFHLNTDSSMVKFPEIQYICTMTDFSYNMDYKGPRYGTERKIRIHPLLNPG